MRANRHQRGGAPGRGHSLRRLESLRHPPNGADATAAAGSATDSRLVPTEELDLDLIAAFARAAAQDDAGNSYGGRPWTGDPGDTIGAGDDASGLFGPADPAGPVTSRSRRSGVRSRLVTTMPGGLVRSVLIVAAVVAAGLLARVLLSDAGTSVDTIAGEEVSSASADVTGSPGPSPPGTGSAVPPMTAASGSVVATGSVRTVVVHVIGKVRRPGLVTLAPGARVADALSGAGGAASGAATDRINLARPVSDGEQIVVPAPGDPLPTPAAAGEASGGGAAGAAGSSGGGTSGGSAGAGGAAGAVGTVNLNTATLSQLDSLPGIGPAIAQRILAWRQEHQRFSRVEELREVSGIGPKLMERLRPLVTV